VKKTFFYLLCISLSLTSCSPYSSATISSKYAANAPTTVTNAPLYDTQTRVVQNDRKTSTDLHDEAIKATQTPFPVNKSTPLPTILPAIKEEFVHKVMDSSSICKLPCWAKVIPGKTRYEDAYEFLSGISKSIYVFDYSYVGFLLEDKFSTDKSFLVLHTNHDQVIDRMYVRNKLSIKGFLSEYGIPEEIWFSTNYIMKSDISEGYWEIILILFYPSQGFAATYEGKAIEIRGESLPLEICNSSINEEVELFLRQKGELNTMPYVTSDDYWSYYSSKYFSLLQEKSDLSNQQFYELFVNEQATNKCFIVEYDG
jgi:hypothetical protein